MQRRLATQPESAHLSWRPAILTDGEEPCLCIPCTVFCSNKDLLLYLDLSLIPEVLLKDYGTTQHMAQ